MHRKTIAQLRQVLDSRVISCVELVSEYYQRIEKFDDTLNSFISLNKDAALDQARHSDKLIASGQATALTGIPIAHKDIFCTQGIKTSCGSKMLDNFIAPYDATVVKKMRDAGVIMLGKTNMDEFAMGSSNENSHYGPVRNPWNIERIPGGSSGGSAAAVAARLVPAATGTDTGGSIRQPAALCGITGIKPTYGRVSRYGMVAFASSLDQAGPMTINAEDAAIMLNAMVGFDKHDSTSVEHSDTDFTADLNRSLQGKKIGLPKEYFSESLDVGTAKAVTNAIKELEKLGAQLVDISLPHTEVATSAYYVIAPAEASSNLARYDGVRYGYRCEDPKDVLDLYQRSRSEAFGEEVKRRILIGTYVLSSGYYDAYYVQAQKVRRLIRNDFVRAFESVDVILTPTTPAPAFSLGSKANDPLAMYLTDVFSPATNLAGLPGLSMPIGFSHDLPVGAQLIGPHFSESTLLNVAHQYQQVTDWHLQTPPHY